MQSNPTYPQRWIIISSFLFLAFSCTSLVGQAPRNIPYFKKDLQVSRDKLAEETALSIHTKFVPPDRFDKEAKKAFQTQEDALAENISTEIAENALLDDAIWPFLKKVHANITTANPQAKAVQIIPVAYPMANAFSVGDGTIIVYTGLLAGLENESQVAFVLCHEIAHFLLEHSKKGLEKQISTLYSKEFKEKVKAAKDQEYNQYAQMESLVKNVVFNARYHHRDIEKQADSLAWQLYRKTSYDPSQAARLMEVFEYIDQPLRDTVLHPDRDFGCTQYPFRAQWLEKEQGSVWAAAAAAHAESEKPMQDSLRTHPEWKKRLNWLSELERQYAPEKQDYQPAAEEDYQDIKKLSIIESVGAWYDYQRYDRTLYYAVQYQQVYPDIQYFTEIQALALHGLYSHTKDHTISDVLSRGSQDFPEKYNAFLAFLNNLRMKDMLGLQECSINSLKEPKTEYGLMAAYWLASAREDRSGMSSAERAYIQNFKGGRFSEFFKNN